MTDRKQREGIRPPGPDQKVTLIHWFQYISLRLLSLATSILPYSLARAIGRGLGAAFYKVDKARRKIALLNLDQVFGETKTEEEKLEITRNCFLHFGQAVVEMLRLSKINERNFLKHVEISNVAMFYEGLRGEKGVILCSAHYGNWEIMNLALGYLNLPMSVMARPIDNPLIHNYLEKIRTRSGNGVIYKHKSVRRLLSGLSQNRIIGIVNDQDVHDRNRIMAEFFGHQASTTPVPAALAYKTGAPIVTGFAVPLGKGRYLLKFGELIHADQTANKDEEIMRITMELNRRLETQITVQPSPWMWLHQRFKTGPEGRTDFYKRDRQV